MSDPYLAYVNEERRRPRLSRWTVLVIGFTAGNIFSHLYPTIVKTLATAWESLT